MIKKGFLFAMTLLAGLLLTSCSLIRTVLPPPSSGESSSSISIGDDDSSSGFDDDSDVSSSIATQRIGSDDYGYIDIPDNWIKFTDANAGDSIQYSDGSNYNIVTLNAYTREKANISAGEDFTPETLANRVASNWDGRKDVDDYWGAKTTVAGIDSYQVNVNFKSGQQAATWIFKKGEKIYMITVEGDEDTLSELVAYVEDTWSLSKDGGSSI
ncbi:hypothetical protein ACVRXQ_11255 [Streptococcus panodentis]|uniref:Lipoprotein n=1 Tax=Streptococcus panodentis TaxID=1581472 RepID=A0ABS5AZN4_9STRE|nr:hypothetical protein [Streptococcus panodentis]MBP2621708.1 hypothetical protein [Streptococcus panodentis]